jgi:cold shock CspA family protein
MGRSQETAGKKGVRTKNEKKRKEKAQKRALKKVEGKKNSFDDMIAYVDEFGRISSTPPDPDKKTEIVAENIELTMTRNKQDNPLDLVKKGVVTFFDDSKGFGFIRELESNQSVFVHVNSLSERISENNLVTFEVVKGVKGPAAINVKIVRD